MPSAVHLAVLPRPLFLQPPPVSQLQRCRFWHIYWHKKTPYSRKAPTDFRGTVFAGTPDEALLKLASFW